MRGAIKLLLALNEGVGYPLTNVVNFATGQTWTFSGTSGQSGAMVTDVKWPGFDRAARLVCPAGSNTTCRANRTVTTKGLNASGTFIVAFYAETWTSTDRINVILNDGGGSPDGAFFAFDIVRAGWNIVYIDGTAFSPALTGVDQVLFRFQLFSTSGGSSVVVGGIWYQPVEPPAKVMLDFDDGFLSQYTEAFSYMQPLGVPATIGVIADTVGEVAGGLDAFDYCSQAQLQEMYGAGWDMAVHGYDNHVSDLGDNLAVITADVAANRSYVIAQGWTRAQNHYIYPGGGVGSNSIAALQANDIVTGRLTNGVSFPTNFGMDQPFRQWSKPVNSAAGLVALKALVDSVILRGGTLRLYPHRIVTSVADANNEILRADFRELIDYIVTKRSAGLLTTPTLSQWYNSLPARVLA